MVREKNAPYTCDYWEELPLLEIAKKINGISGNSSKRQKLLKEPLATFGGTLVVLVFKASTKLKATQRNVQEQTGAIIVVLKPKHPPLETLNM